MVDCFSRIKIRANSQLWFVISICKIVPNTSLTAFNRNLRFFSVAANANYYIKVIGHLHFFLVIDENESVFIIGQKVYHFFCDDEKVQMGRLRSDAQLKMFTVSAQTPVISLFLS